MENKVFCTRDGHAPIFSDAHQCALAHIGNICEYMCKYMHKYLHFPHPHGHPYFAHINSTSLLQFKGLKEDIFASFFAAEYPTVVLQHFIFSRWPTRTRKILSKDLSPAQGEVYHGPS